MPAVRIIFFCLFFSFTEKVFAQSDIADTVVNTTNSRISFAGVTLKAGTFEKNIQSDSTGKFTFNKLENGTSAVVRGTRITSSTWFLAHESFVVFKSKVYIVLWNFYNSENLIHP
jgi:hypothetical protein